MKSSRGRMATAVFLVGLLAMLAFLAPLGGCSGEPHPLLSDVYSDRNMPGGPGCVGASCPNSCANKPNQPGCPCTTEGAQQFCAKVETVISGQAMCGTGYSVCSRGTWQPCIINGAVLAPLRKPGDLRAKGLGTSAGCDAQDRQCDPTCVNFTDSPSGLGDLDAGLSVTDSGLTLAGEGGSVCVPTTCAIAGKNCGPMSDRCGGILDCGTCVSPEVCGSASANVCGVPGDCTGLCLQQTNCAGQATSTTITGIVRAPNGVDPLPNVMVYIPNGTPQAFPTGVSCDICGTQSAAQLGYPFVSTLTDIYGQFTLRNVPATNIGPQNPVPLVMQLGRWRRQITLSSTTSVPACQTTTLSTTVNQSLMRLPKNQSEGDIPRFAFSTGKVDGMECIMRKIGIDDSEFTNPGGTGRIHLYQGGAAPGSFITAATPWETDLLGVHWSYAAAMNAARWRHTATLLSDGTVFVAGGASSATTSSLATTELYNAGTNTWTSRASMTQARAGATATLLNNGKVLVAGGYSFPSTYVTTAELYDPSANTWAAAGTLPMIAATCRGSVVISGVYGNSGTSGASYEDDWIELHNRGDTAASLVGWSVQTAVYNGTLWTKADFPSGASIPAGGFYLVRGAHGGSGGSALNNYDYLASSLAVNATNGKVALVNNTTALTIAGPTAANIVDFVGYGTATASEGSSAAPAVDTTHWDSRDTGGSACSDTNVNSANFTKVNSPAPRRLASTAVICTCGMDFTGRAFHTASLLNDGKVLVAGGVVSGSWITNLASLYDPTSNTWTSTIPLSDFHWQHTATRLSDGKILIAGGDTSAVEVYSSTTTGAPTWTTKSALSDSRRAHTASVRPDGRVVLTGGYVSDAIKSTYMYSSTPNSWTAGPDSWVNHAYHGSVQLADGTTMISGGLLSDSSDNLFGTSSGTFTANTAVYDQVSNKWVGKDGGLRTARGYHTMTQLQNGKVLVTGGYDGSSVLSSAELSGTAATLGDYDVTGFFCQGTDYAWSSGRVQSDGSSGLDTGSTGNNTSDGLHAILEQNVADFAGLGGRVFATHYNYAWLYSNGAAPYSSTLSAAANWDFSLGSLSNGTGYIDMSFSKGLQLAQWLMTPRIGASTVLGQIDITTLRQDFSTVVSPTSQNWMSMAGTLGNGQPCTSDGQCTSGTCSGSKCAPSGCTSSGTGSSHACTSGTTCCSGFCNTSSRCNSGTACLTTGQACTTGGSVACCSRLCTGGVCVDDVSGTGKQMHFTFNTPISAPTAQQCGRVVYSDFHVYNLSDSHVAFPGECNTGMSDQEKLLEFMMFDLSSCVQADHQGVGTCSPMTCAGQGLNCGPAGDGCGNTIQCGTCTLPNTCGGGGDQGVCGTPKVYGDGYLVRDYSALGACRAGESPVWRLWSWGATTPSDSHIDFRVQTASTSAGLSSAPSDPVLFSDPPGPISEMSVSVFSLSSGVAVAHALDQPTTGRADTQAGSASIDYTFQRNGRVRNDNYVRMTVHFAPSSDLMTAPSLSSWNMKVDCIPAF